MTSDVAQLIRADLSAQESKSRDNRERMPDGARLIDSITRVFGAVKVKWIKSNGLEMGRRPPFEGTDVDKIIRLDDMRKRRVGK